MSYIYVYNSLDDDLSTAGLVGALMPTSCIFSEKANSESSITLQHPLDKYGKYKALKVGRVLRVNVPTRTPPALTDNGKYKTMVEVYHVKDAAVLTKAQRTMYKKVSADDKPSGTVKVLKGGERVYVLTAPVDSRYSSVLYNQLDGYIERDSLVMDEIVPIDEGVDGLETVAGAWTSKPQNFIITKTEPKDEGVVVTAMHEFYNLMHYVADYRNDIGGTLYQALRIMKANSYVKPPFEFFTDITDYRNQGMLYEDENFVKALLDADVGMCKIYNAQMVRDGNCVYFLRHAGTNRGLRVECGKNLAGISFETDASNVVTRVIPVGEAKDGSRLSLDGTKWVDSPKINDYDEPRMYVLEVKEAKVDKTVTVAIARARMRAAAEQYFKDGADEPKITVKVDYKSLGDTEQFKRFKEVEQLYLFDDVQVVHEELGIDVVMQVVSLDWDCVLDCVDKLEIGALKDTVAKVATWQIPSNVSGGKIRLGTVGAGQLGDDIINARHVQADSISTQALQAGAITAEKLNAQDIFADNAEISELLTQKIRATDIDAGNITTGTLTADRILMSDGSTVLTTAMLEMETLATNAMDEATAASDAAETAQTTAETAKTSAASAKSTAEEASGTANAAQETATTAQATAATAQSAASDAQNDAGTALVMALNIEENAVTKEQMARVVRIDDEGLHVGDTENSACEVLLDASSMNVVVNGVRTSTFADKYIRLGNMQIKKVKGGLGIGVYTTN